MHQSQRKRRLRAPIHRLIGYARELSVKPKLATQLRALRAAGCHDDNLWIDRTGSPTLPQRAMAFMDARAGDTLVVASLLCFANSNNSIEKLRSLHDRKIDFVSLHEGIDTRVPGGERFIPVLLEAMERSRKAHVELIFLGLSRARRHGRRGGRRTVLPGEKMDEARALQATGEHSMAAIAERLGVCRATLYNNGLRKIKSRPQGAA